MSESNNTPVGSEFSDLIAEVERFGTYRGYLVAHGVEEPTLSEIFPDVVKNAGQCVSELRTHNRRLGLTISQIRRREKRVVH